MNTLAASEAKRAASAVLSPSLANITSISMGTFLARSSRHSGHGGMQDSSVLGCSTTCLGTDSA